MRRKLTLITMLFAWLLATGSHWDLVQTFAWGRMIVTYSESMPLAQAIKLTFTPENVCGVCESVGEAKRHQNTALPADGTGFGKIHLVFQPATVFCPAPPARGKWIAREHAPVVRDRLPPPVPPPRVTV